MEQILGRPTNIVGGLIFYQGFFFLSLSLSFFFFFTFRRLISELAERNSTKICHMLGSNCDLKTHVQNLGYPLPYKWGPQNHLYGRLRKLTATLTAYYIFGKKRDIDSRSSALTTTRSLYIVSKCRELWSTNGFKLDRHFSHPT